MRHGHWHRGGCDGGEFPGGWGGLFGVGRGHGRGGAGGPMHFFFDGGSRGSGGGPRGRKRMFESGELRLVLLKLIADEPRHGYDLIRAIEELTDGEYVPSPGVVYPTLTLLLDMGLIEEAPSEGSRKPFQIRKDGRLHLEENSEAVARLFERLEQHGSHRRGGRRPEIARAAANLMTALRNRIGEEGLDEALLREVVEILDDAARRIERL